MPRNKVFPVVWERIGVSVGNDLPVGIYGERSLLVAYSKQLPTVKKTKKKNKVKRR